MICPICGSEMVLIDWDMMGEDWRCSFCEAEEIEAQESAAIENYSNKDISDDLGEVGEDGIEEWYDDSAAGFEDGIKPAEWAWREAPEEPPLTFQEKIEKEKESHWPEKKRQWMDWILGK